MATNGTATNAAEVEAHLRSRNSLIFVQTVEENRAKCAIAEMATKRNYLTRVWTCTEGVCDVAGQKIDDQIKQPDKVLEAIRDRPERAVWILCDFHAYLGNATVNRLLRSLAMALPKVDTKQARAIIILTPSEKIPMELPDQACVVKWKLPDREELGKIFDDAIAGAGLNVADAAPNGTREAAIEATVGLTAEGASRALSKCLVTQKKKIVPSVIAEEKRSVISARGIEWYEPDPRGLAGVGGLDNAKVWLTHRKSAFSEKARAFGLPRPKGVLLLGPPGCGKSAMAKAVAAAWQFPLLKFDAGAQKGGIVGESERNARAAYATADAVGRCVLWFDEIEKMFGGAQGALDGGVSADALGTFLTWMQEKKTDVFVVATANSIDKLPPEMLRKGRFDELFFVDLPTQVEREEIIKVSLAKCGRDVSGIDVAKIAAACVDFSGVETAELVPNALYVAFADGERALTTEDLLAGARSTVPLAKTSAEKIKSLREWAKGRTRPASTPEVSTTATGGRSLDLGE